MIYFTQLIYIKEGQENVFDQFEAMALPLLAKHNGLLLLRVKPTEESIIDGYIDIPYEIHFGSFESEQDFQAFMQDEERKQYLHLKVQSIESVLLIKGSKV